jgi:hypothetical protein
MARRFPSLIFLSTIHRSYINPHSVPHAPLFRTVRGCAQHGNKTSQQTEKAAWRMVTAYAFFEQENGGFSDASKNFSS